MAALIIESFRISEFCMPRKRLGRHVRHDPRSWCYPAAMAAEIKSVLHKRSVPAFYQGPLGSCTGCAAAGCMSTLPFKRTCTERDVIAIYALATHFDEIDGTYPPNDTGSSGLGAMKALKHEGWISAYTHTFTLNHTLRALVLGPGITGFIWRTGCDEPDSAGVVRYTGQARGGHEVQLIGLDAKRHLVWFVNSWGPRWGKSGRFAMSFKDYEKALADHGDATFPSLESDEVVKTRTRKSLGRARRA
jgi:hypothetical protein